MSKKFVYLFKEGNANMRELLGGKGANLAEMTSLGLPVPQGFTVTTEACTQYYEDGRKINDDIQAEIMENVAKMEEINGKKFGDLKAALEKSGNRVDDADIIIAATAICNDATLATGNVKHFSRFEGLKLQNWFE